MMGNEEQHFIRTSVCQILSHHVRTKIEPSDSLIVKMSLKESWRRLFQHFQVFLEASSIAKKLGQVKSFTLLNVTGPEALEIYTIFQWEQEECKLLDKVALGFQYYFDSHKSVT